MKDILLKFLSVKNFLTIFYLFATALLLNSILEFFLPKITQEYIFYNNSSKIFHSDISKLFCPVKSDKKKKSLTSFDFEVIKDLKLKAIYIDEIPDKSFIIVSNGQREDFIFLGDVYKNYLLKDIKPNFAVFERMGKRYILYLENGKKERFEKREEQESDTDFVKISKNEFLKYKKKINKLVNDISLDPIDYKGIKAYKITYLRKHSPLRKLGIKEGDIIYQINGEGVENPSILNKIINGEKIEGLYLSIYRNNEEKEIYYEIE